LSKTVDSPIIALFEDRPKQRMVYQLNLSVYLDARVIFVSTLKEMSGAIAGPEGIHLAVVRENSKENIVSGKVAEALVGKGIPMISLGGKERLGVVAVSEDNGVKPMLQAAAKILGITAKQMAEKTRPELFEIAPEYLNMLFSAPCKIHRRVGSGKEQLFNTGEIISREKIKQMVEIREPLVIDAYHRLRLAGAVTEQNLNAAKELSEPSVPEEKKMTILASSLEMVAAQFKNAGMDAETVELANASISAIEKIAKSATSVGNLVKQLMQAQGGYRYAHSQLITFLGFHVIKMMGWWGDEQRSIISQAAFYHDISLGTDEEAKIHSEAELRTSGFMDPEKLETILTHAQLSARELQTVPDISPEVVRVVIQHHGSPVGRGFSADIAGLENLSKVFLLAEEWSDYLIGLSEGDQTPDNGAKISELKAIFKDEQSQQIIETFRYLDPEQFKNDFLEVPEYALGGSSADNDFAAALVSGSASLEEAAAAALRVDGSSAEAELEQAFDASSLTSEEEEILIKGAKVEEESRRIGGVTDVRKDEEILVEGDKSPKDLIDRSITKIKASTPEAQKQLKMKALAAASDLMKAALSGSTEAIGEAMAVAQNAPMEIRKTDAEGRSAIHYAAMGGSIPALKLLLEKGAQMNVADSKRRSPLFLSALHRRNDAFTFLLTQGGKINQQAMGGMTIAMIGAFSGNMIVLKAAVEKGVRIDTKDHSGKTALDHAKHAKSLECIAYLESLGKKEVLPTPAAA